MMLVVFCTNLYQTHIETINSPKPYPLVQGACYDNPSLNPKMHENNENYENVKIQYGISIKDLILINEC